MSGALQSFFATCPRGLELILTDETGTTTTQVDHGVSSEERRHKGVQCSGFNVSTRFEP